MPRATTWTNKDGLTVGFGTHSTDDAIPGVLNKSGEKATIKFSILDMSLLNDDVTDTTGADVGLYSQGIRLPANCTVTEVRIVTQTACTGTSSTLLIGNYTKSATTGVYTAVDIDGFCDAIDGALANFNAAGETKTLTKADSAALLGKAVAHTAASYVFPIYGTAFTAGAVDVYIDYIQ
jgi:hypothetical protein